MGNGIANRTNERSWVLAWLLLLVLLLLLVKFFFLGTFYVEEPRSLLFVAIQAEPRDVGDKVVIEFPNGDLTIAKFKERDRQSLLVEVEGEPIRIDPEQLKGKVIGRLKL